MFFLWAGINIKLMILRIFQSLLRRKLYPQKIENAFFSILCLVLTSKFSGVGSKYWKGGGLDLSIILNQQKMKWKKGYGYGYI